MSHPNVRDTVYNLTSRKFAVCGTVKPWYTMIMWVSPCDSLVNGDLKRQLSQSDHQCHNLSDELWNARNRRYRKNAEKERA